MHAILREATYATDTPVHESREFKEFQALHARQPGDLNKPLNRRRKSNWYAIR